MVILSITNCPPRLRGDLSKWLNEINTGVYIGKLSARVREELWDRICKNIRDGQATMIYSAANAQGFEILVHNTSWTPVDFDGITLMRRPLKQTDQTVANELKPGYSKASKYQMARKRKADAQKNYQVVLDLETTGLDAEKDHIIEIGAIKYANQEITDTFQCLIRSDRKIPEKIENLTGISNKMAQEEGVEEKEAIKKLLKFIGSYTVIGYNVKFDLEFVQIACECYHLENSIKKSKDILAIARRKIEDVENYKMDTVAQYFGIERRTKHRALEDCEIAYRIYSKLNEM